MKKHMRRHHIYYLGVIALFIIGCSIHFTRGYYSVFGLKGHAWGMEDSYISYRYGWNYIHTGLLSWNESGYRQTEGFTNPLWVYLSALWAIFNNKDLVYPGMVITSVILSILFIAGLIRSILQHSTHDARSTTGIALLCLSPVLWLHSTSGLESGVFGLAIAYLAYLLLEQGHAVEHQLSIENDPRRSAKEREGLYPYSRGLAQRAPRLRGFLTDSLDRRAWVKVWMLTALIVFLRSDGFVYVAIIAAGVLIARPSAVAPLIGGLACSLAILLAWRLLHFGALAPNTSVAKLNFSVYERSLVGWHYLRLTMIVSGIGVFCIIGLLGAALRSRRALLGAGVVLGGWCGYFVFIGGDHFLERHLVGVMALAAAFSGPLWARLRPTAAALGAAGLLLFVVGPPAQGDPRFPYHTAKSADPLIVLGRALADDRARFGTLVSFAAGKIPFFAGGDCIDPIGLNDPELARIKAPTFTPGHSSGSMAEAIRIARSHGDGTYAFVTLLGAGAPPSGYSPSQIALWVDNDADQPHARTAFTAPELQAALARAEAWYVVVLPR